MEYVCAEVSRPFLFLGREINLPFLTIMTNNDKTELEPDLYSTVSSHLTRLSAKILEFNPAIHMVTQWDKYIRRLAKAFELDTEHPRFQNNLMLLYQTGSLTQLYCEYTDIYRHIPTCLNN